MNWQPLSTYPKGNLRVLVRRTSPNKSHWHNTHPIIVAHSHNGEKWWSEPGMYQTYPTHWMPLPALPNDGDNRQPGDFEGRGEGGVELPVGHEPEKI